MAFAFPVSALAATIGERKRPLQSRSRDTVAAILEATLQVLGDSGLARLSTTRVAERAGVSIGTLYQYFPDKRALVSAIAVHYVERVMVVIEACAAAQVGAPIEIAVREVLGSMLTAKRTNMRFVTALSDPEIRVDQTIYIAQASILASVTRMLGSAFPHLPDPLLNARVLVGLVNGATAVAVSTEGMLQSEAFGEELVNAALAYVRTLNPLTTA